MEPAEQSRRAPVSGALFAREWHDVHLAPTRARRRHVVSRPCRSHLLVWRQNASHLYGLFIPSVRVHHTTPASYGYGGEERG